MSSAVREWMVGRSARGCRVGRSCCAFEFVRDKRFVPDYPGVGIWVMVRLSGGRVTPNFVGPDFLPVACQIASEAMWSITVSSAISSGAVSRWIWVSRRAP